MALVRFFSCSLRELGHSLLSRFAWELLWLSGPICILMFITLPETSTANILLRRARRLRRVTDKKNIKSQSEIDQKNLTPTEVAYDALIKPWQINFLDPAVVRIPLYSDGELKVTYL